MCTGGKILNPVLSGVLARSGQGGQARGTGDVPAAPVTPTLPALPSPRDDPGGRARRGGMSTTSLLAQGPTVLGS